MSSEGKKTFYLSEFAEKAKMPIQDVEDFFIPLLKVGKVEGRLEIRCPQCGRDQGEFKKVSEIPDEITCEICQYEFPRGSESLEIVLEVKDRFFRAGSDLSSCNQEDSDHRESRATPV